MRRPALIALCSLAASCSLIHGLDEYTFDGGLDASADLDAQRRPRRRKRRVHAGRTGLRCDGGRGRRAGCNPRHPGWGPRFRH